MRVVTILGTRPEIIRLSRVIPAFDRVFDHLLVHTGQNLGFDLSDVFFRDLGLRAADFHLGISRSSIGRMMGELFIEIEQVLQRTRPDAVLILGDTNSALSAIVARRLGIPVYHMEAGNRSFDPNVPEETNRRLVDHASDINLVYTEQARRNLLAEGVHPRCIYLSGSPMREVLEYARSRIESSDVLSRNGLEEYEYLVASFHRAENVDDRRNLLELTAALQGLYDLYRVPIVVSTHPRTRERLSSMGFSGFQGDIRLLDPFPYHDYLKLQSRARCTLSDSGTIGEESAMLGFPAVTPRYSIERPEALDTGAVIVTGLDRQVIHDAVAYAISSRSGAASRQLPREYEVTDTSDRVVRIVLGTCRLCRSWQGMRSTSAAGS